MSLQKKILTILFLFFAACTPTKKFNSIANDNFKKKYGQQVMSIQQKRQEMFENTPKEIQNADYNTYNSSKNAFLVSEEKPIDPTQQQSVNKFPDDMFDVNYDTKNHSAFEFAGLEFDSIQIPPKDFYGVKSGFDDKQYFLAGNNILQKNIDNINNSRTQDDINISQTLIKEQKELRKQQKLSQIFAEDVSVIEKEKNKTQNDNKISSQEDMIKKSIALQIIERNLSQNKNTSVNQ